MRDEVDSGNRRGGEGRGREGKGEEVAGLLCESLEF